MAALLKNLFQAGRIKTQTHPLAPDVHLARLTASLYLICCPVKRWTFEKLKCVRCIRELKKRTAGATTLGIVGEGSRSKNHWDQQINRIWDLQASEVNDTLKKKKNSKKKPWGKSQFSSFAFSFKSRHLKIFQMTVNYFLQILSLAGKRLFAPRFSWRQYKTIVTVCSVLSSHQHNEAGNREVFLHFFFLQGILERESIVMWWKLISKPCDLGQFATSSRCLSSSVKKKKRQGIGF